MTDSELFSAIINVWQFLEYLLPATITISMIVVVYIMLRREHTERKTARMRSPEWQMVQSLIEAKAITREEGEVLLENSTPDEDENRFAVPDVQLKIVSYFGRIFSILKILYLMTRLLIVLIVAFWLPFEFKTSAKPELSILLIVGGILWAVLEYTASAKVLGRSVWSWRFLIFNWIANIVLARGVFSDIDPVCFCLPPLAGGIYSLYVLALRRNAGKFVFGNGDGIPQIRRIPLLLIMICAVIWGVFHCNINRTGNVVHDLKVSLGAWTSSSIREIVLVEGSHDVETRYFCHQLAESIHSKLGIPCRVVNEGAPLRLESQNGLMTLLIMRTKIIPPLHDWHNISQDDDHRSMESAYGLLTELAGRHNLLAFKIMPLDDDNFGLSYYNGLKFMSANPALKGVVTGEAKFTDVRGTIRSMIPVVLARLREAVSPGDGRPSLELPPLRLANEVKLPVLPRGLLEPELIYYAHSIRLNTLAVYRFKIRDTESLLKRLAREMEAMGFILYQRYEQDGKLIFYGKKHRRKYIFDIRETGVGHLNNRPAYGILTFLDTTPRENMSYDEGFHSRYLRRDPRSFALAHGLSGLSGAAYQEAFKRVISSGKLTLAEKLAILAIEPHQEEEVKNFAEYQEFYRQTADEMIGEMDSHEFIHRLGIILYLGKFSGQDQYLLKKLEPIRVREKYPAGEKSARFIVKRKPIAGSRVIFELDMPEASPIVLPMSVTAMKKHGYHFHSGAVWLDFVDGGSISGTLKFDGTNWLPGPPQMNSANLAPGHAYYKTRFDLEHHRYVIDVYYEPPAKEK